MPLNLLANVPSKVALSSVLALLPGLFVPAFAQGLPSKNVVLPVHTTADTRNSKTSADRLTGQEAHNHAVESGARSNWRPTPRPGVPDISIEPIAAKEPVPPAGFPFLPYGLDLPVAAHLRKAPEQHYRPYKIRPYLHMYTVPACDPPLPLPIG